MAGAQTSTRLLPRASLPAHPRRVTHGAHRFALVHVGGATRGTFWFAVPGPTASSTPAMIWRHWSRYKLLPWSTHPRQLILSRSTLNTNAGRLTDWGRSPGPS